MRVSLPPPVAASRDAVRWRLQAAAAAVGFSAAFLLCYVVMVRTAAGQAADVRLFRLVFGIVPAGVPAELVTAFARAASVVVLAGGAAVLGVAALGRRAWSALLAAVVTVGASVTLGVYLRDEVLTRPRFTDEAFPINSLPSTHATAAAALTMAVVVLWPRHRPWWLVNTGRRRPAPRRRGQHRQPGPPSERRPGVLPPRRRGGGRGPGAWPGRPARATRVPPCRPPPGRWRSTSRSSTRSPRTTSGGGRGSPSGPTWRKARRLFPGHQQPTLPADLGFYDLRVPETRAAQAELAQEHGVEAFVYWHYWFGDGDRILERPFGEVLASGEPGISFCLAWANQTWIGDLARRQGPGAQGAALPGSARRRAPFRRAAAGLHRPALRHRRRPAAVLRVPPRGPPDAPAVRRALAGHGPRRRPAGPLPRRGDERPARARAGIHLCRRRRVRRVGLRAAPRRGDHVDTWRGCGCCVKAMRGGPEIYRYSDTVVAESLAGAAASIPCVYPNWDNTPRSGRAGLALVGATPERFRRNVVAAVDTIRRPPPADAAALGEVVERVGRGQPPRTRPP